LASEAGQTAAHRAAAAKTKAGNRRPRSAWDIVACPFLRKQTDTQSSESGDAAVNRKAEGDY
jgi:hypothetical protein